MPIYAYRCTQCGFEKEVMQKISDPLLTTCPSCQAETFAKQLTAPGFQLKGSGWYATDFKGGNKSSTTEVASSAPPPASTTNASSPVSATPAAPAAPTTSSTATSTSSVS
ncbi:MAG: zinc ribbon domain-containing protein [Rhodocyclales bacterium]|nr:zinc ribbon domain-containing protein [Rhodocyclales bacterium]